MEREAFLYVKAKLLNSSIENRNNFGSGKVHFNLTGTYMNDSSRTTANRVGSSTESDLLGLP